MTDAKNNFGILYIVATPIGNLSDISARAIDTLSGVDMILSEDTRVTGKLLSRFEIKTRQISYHDYSEKKKAPSIIGDLKIGKNLALVSDAGTPLISDPGYTLVNMAIREGIEIIPIPGPSSILTALSISGFPSDRFCFEGYAPRTEGKLKRFFESLKDESRTVVFFETPHRIKKSLKIMLDVLGNLEIFVGRELTKKFEEKLRGNIEEIRTRIEDRTIKGEIVVIIKAHD
ncbi:MAG: 16S rRNA (cytidine(1402)-2'-O)-methyltransferase [candidate division Zixibacteria bacterium]